MSNQCVYLVEADQHMRRSFRWMTSGDGIRVKEYGVPSAFLAEYNTQMHGCLVISLELPEMTGLELGSQLVQMGSRVPFIVTSVDGTVCDATAAMRLGAVDFLLKPVDRDLFLERVSEAFERDAMEQREQAQVAATQAKIDSLTQREREVLDYVVAGRLTKQIAKELDVSTKTIETHRSRITRKFGVESVAQLVRVVVQHTEHAR